MAATSSDAPSKDGLPEVDSMGFFKSLPILPIVVGLPRAICFAAALAIYRNGDRTLYDKNIAKLSDSGTGYLYAAAVLFGLLVTWLNNYPTLYKSMVMRFGSGNLRANMQIYKVLAAGIDPSHVVLETQGALGSYNRANRSLHHFGENALPAVVCMVLGGQIFPFPTFACVAALALGRIMHQVGYASIGYGGHALGFAIATFATTTMEMLCLLTAIKSIGLPASAAGVMASLEAKVEL